MYYKGNNNDAVTSDLDTYLISKGIKTNNRGLTK